MATPATEVAAATLEHSERIRRLTEAVDGQRRTVAKLSYAVGFLVILQVLQLIPLALGESNPAAPLSGGLARGALIGIAAALVASVVTSRKLRAA